MSRLAKSTTCGFAAAALVGFAMLASAGLGQSAQAQDVRPDFNKTKSSKSLRGVFTSVVMAADQATVSVQGDTEKDKTGQVALGTVVAADGFILTKASEVVGHSKLDVVVRGRTLPAKVVGVSEPQDLAMLKVDAGGLTVAPWADTKTDKIEVGEWVASTGAISGDEEPLAVGVVSVGRRKIGGQIGFLGVHPDDTANGTGTKITEVVERSPADKAGLKVDDVIDSINGRVVNGKEALFLAMHEFRPGDVVTLSVTRDGKPLTLKATLGANVPEMPSRYSMMNLMGGELSKRASDFPLVFQHDTVIRPNDCGGPVVDLSGKVIGINIARAGRTETYALPAEVVLALLPPLENGKLAPVNANVPSPPVPAKTSTMPGSAPVHGQ